VAAKKKQAEEAAAKANADNKATNTDESTETKNEL